MLSSQILFVILGFAWITTSGSVPLVEKEFFWYPTDKGTVVPALLKSRPDATVNAIEDDVAFWHYLVGETVEKGRVITPNCDQCLSSFVKGAPTVFMAHGFSSDHEGGFGNNLREGFASKGEPVNLVFINWSKLAAAPWYESAANSVPAVGEYSARMIDFIVAEGVTSLDNIYYIGHSLGAHIANAVANNMKQGKLPHIFAMDPALPLFGVKNDTERIDPSDGDFVNVFHTSMGTLADGGLAFEEPRGHADFYPNSGKHQPGCPSLDFGACSHSRSYGYLAESISKPASFSACKCTNWDEYSSGKCTCQEKAVMGWATPTTTRGLYFLRTNSASPFSQS